QLLKLGDTMNHLVFNMHHVISDGWSMGIITREFNDYYQKINADSNYQPQPLQYQYKDFAAWNNKQITRPDSKERKHNYWKEKVKGGVPIVQLPADNPQNRDSKRGAAYSNRLESEMKTQLKEIATKNKTSLFVVMYSAYLILLTRYSKQTEIASSIIAAGREHISLRDIVGYFVNSLLFKIHVDPEESYEQFLDRVHQSVMESNQNQDYPVEHVLHELKMSYPEIPVSFNMLNIRGTAQGKQQEDMKEEQQEKNGTQHTPHVQEVKFDIEPYISETNEGIQMDWRYKKDLFKPGTIEYIATEYIRILRYFGEKPQNKIKEFSQKTKKRGFKRT
ncbi:MAG: hypothetical protein GY757_42495, partial [bacterium]|nr:hypothetical protein [bacterium]